MRNVRLGLGVLALGRVVRIGAPALPRIAVGPYAVYGFFGLRSAPRRAADEPRGRLRGRAALRLGPRWSAYGNLQQIRPRIDTSNVRPPVTHSSVESEFACVPRGRAGRMPPMLLDAGLGQVRYDNGPRGFAVKLGRASALARTPRVAMRHGVEDCVSTYRGDWGWVRPIFAMLGVEVAFECRSRIGWAPRPGERAVTADLANRLDPA